MTELEEKIARLPAWVRDHIKYLKGLPAVQTEELARLRKRIEHLEQLDRKRKDQIEAMVNFFQCAAKGEHEVAKAVKTIVEDFLTPMEPEDK